MLPPFFGDQADNLISGYHLAESFNLYSCGCPSSMAGSHPRTILGLVMSHLISINAGTVGRGFLGITKSASLTSITQEISGSLRTLSQGGTKVNISISYYTTHV